MRTTEYLINAVFVLIVFRQAHERELDRRAVVIPMVIVAFVAHLYVHAIPTAGNDLVLIGTLGIVGLALGVASGFATPSALACTDSPSLAAHHIGAAAWPMALVLMALLEVTTRIAIVQLRGRQVLRRSRRFTPGGRTSIRPFSNVSWPRSWINPRPHRLLNRPRFHSPICPTSSHPGRPRCSG